MRLSLRARQVTVVTSLALFSIVLLAGVYLSSLVRLGLDENRARGELLARSIFHRARLVVGTAEDPKLALRDDPGIRAILESSIAYTESVTYATVVDIYGIAIAHSSPSLEGTRQSSGPELASLVDGGTLRQIQGVYRDSTLEVVEPLMLGDEPFGSIRVGLSTVLIRNELGRVLRPAALAVLATLAAAFVLSLVLAQWALKPIHVIRAGLDQLGQGESNVQLTLPPSADFSDLGKSFEAISARLAAQPHDGAGSAESSRQLAELGHMLRGVAHEVKNPLNAMAIHLELLRQKLSDERQLVTATSVRGSVLGLSASQPQASDTPTTALLSPSPSPGIAETKPGVDVLQHVAVLGNEVRRLDDVIQGFLRFIRPEELVQETLDVTDLIDELINLVRPEAERTGVTIDHTHPSLPSIVRCDRAMLRQGLLNLTVNAFQAMPDGGHMRIAVSHQKGWIQIDIEDDGPGMPPEVLERAFELYYTTKAEGSGIGLSMVFRIMQLHGGSIDIESTLGGGTRVRSKLPQELPEHVQSATWRVS
jgi:signal transduction histidine kinase